MSAARIFSSILLAAPVAALCATGCLAPDDGADVDQDAASSAAVSEVTADPTIVIPPGPDEGGVHIEATAPSCIIRTLVSTRLVNLSSNCSTTQWVKVIVDLGRDSTCFSIAPHRIVNVSWSWPGTYDGLVSC